MSVHPLLSKCCVLLVLSVFVSACGGSSSSSQQPACDEETTKTLQEECERYGGIYQGELFQPFGQTSGVEPCAQEDGTLREGECALEQDSCEASCEAPPRIESCGDDLSELEVGLAAHGTLLIVGQQIEEGTSAHELFAASVLSFLLNGINFRRVHELDITFSDGLYGVTTGESYVGFRLFFAEDVGNFKAGDTIPHNVFDPTSYVRDVELSFGGTPLDPRIDYQFDMGPLAALIDGNVNIEGDNLSNLAISLNINASSVAMAFDSLFRDTFVPLDPLSILLGESRDANLRLRSEPIRITEYLDAIENDGYAVTYEDSTFGVTFAPGGQTVFETFDTIFDSALVLRSDADGAWFEGTYATSHTYTASWLGASYGGMLFNSGLLSNRERNITNIFCDADHTQSWGVARHNLALDGGVLTLSDGKTVMYGLEEAVPNNP